MYATPLKPQKDSVILTSITDLNTHNTEINNIQLCRTVTTYIDHYILGLLAIT